MASPGRANVPASVPSLRQTRRTEPSQARKITASPLRETGVKPEGDEPPLTSMSATSSAVSAKSRGAQGRISARRTEARTNRHMGDLLIGTFLPLYGKETRNERQTDPAVGWFRVI